MDERDYIGRLRYIILSKVAEADKPIMERAFVSIFKRGWLIEDAIAFCRCMEEVNPNLDEETAMARMKSIRAKYGENINEAFSL